jgi:hypothetical protein
MAQPDSSLLPPESPSRARGIGPAELFLTVFVTGAIVMTIEIVGTRIVGPVFGVGLFVWSALLAVTLAALASGYYAGGVLADRRLTPTLLGSVVVAAGALLAFAPFLGHGVLSVAERLGPRVGPLFAAAVLFAPALMALGMTGPVAVKLTTKSLSRAGRGLGAAVTRTLRAVFGHVSAYRDSEPDPAEPVGNILFFASDSAVDFRIPPDAQFESSAAERIQRSFTAWEVMQHVPDGPLITDARNPLGRLQLPIAERHFAAMNKLLPPEVWLN